MKCHVTVGYALPKERWESAAEHIQAIAPVMSAWLQKENADNMGKQDATDFTNDVLLAVTALRYVAENAADKCRFLPI
jgi:hypothetical protein